MRRRKEKGESEKKGMNGKKNSGGKASSLDPRNQPLTKNLSIKVCRISTPSHERCRRKALEEAGRSSIQAN